MTTGTLGRRRWLRLVVACWVLGLVAGCARSLPDIKPFSDSTASLATTVGAAGDAAIREVSELHDGREAGMTAANELSKELGREWQRRRTVMEAMTRYADSLVAIVDAGQGGEQAARNVAESVQTLAGTVSSAFPAGHPLVAAITDGAAAVYKQIAIERAIREMDRAVAEADPVVQNVAHLLAQDFASLHTIARQKRQLALSGITLTGDIGENYARLNALELGRKRLRSEVFDDSGNFRTGDGMAGKLDQLQRLTSLIESERQMPWHQAYLERKANVQRAYDAQTAVLDQGALVAHAWARSHVELHRAIREGRTPSFVELTVLTTELRQIYSNYRIARVQP